MLDFLHYMSCCARRPDVTVHLVGDPTARVPFAAVRHGNLSPPDLNELYNQTRAGLALSFTNISLLAEELLACGVVPVVNDSPYARADLSSEHVRWAPATPSGLADALIAVVDAPPEPALVAASVRRDVWRPAQAAFVRAVETEIYAARDAARQAVGGRGTHVVSSISCKRFPSMRVAATNPT